ncbi:MAG: methyltransferase domain-containing protein [Myxococcota bacterium]
MLIGSLIACSGEAPMPTEPEAHHEAHGARHEGGHEGHPNVDHAHHRFDDVERWTKVFDDPERDAWQRPEEVVAAMAVSPGMTVADIGAGTGYFNPHLAQAVGPSGHVVAIDIEPNLVAHMTKRAEADGTPQVEARLVQPDAHGLSAGEADRVLLVDTYHHIEGREAYFRSLLTAMKPGGELVIVDLTREAPFGPPPEMRLSAEQVKTELASAGWAFVRSVDTLPNQYVVVFTPAG